MRKLFLLSALLVSAFFSGEAAAQETKGSEAMNAKPKILIAYYSYSGNTAQVAKAIQAQVGGDLFEIKSDHRYPSDSRSMVHQAKQELDDGFRPVLTTKIENMAQYDVVFLGSPNWWGTITPQVSAFMESYDLKGKKVVPFITHGGGGVQNTIKDLTAQCKGCSVEQNGWSGYGKDTAGVSAWLASVKLAR